MSIYNIAQPVGAMLSGAMQGALSTNLNGSLGRAGWRWAFIINVCSEALSELLMLTVSRVSVRYLLLYWHLSFFLVTYVAIFPHGDPLVANISTARTPKSVNKVLPQASTHRYIDIPRFRLNWN